MTYAIFQVYDYKGGELNSKINLSKKELIEELSNPFENHFDNDLFKDLEIVKEFVNKCINKEDFLTEYAYGGWCGEIFEVQNYTMKELSFNSFLEEIAQYIFDNWFNETEE